VTSSVSTELRFVSCAAEEWNFAGENFSRIGRNGRSTFWVRTAG